MWPLFTLCRALNRREAQYVVVGGMAMIQQGPLRATEDIDLLLASSRANIERHELNGVSTPFASAPLLLRMKQTEREKDALDRRFLEQKIARQDEG